MGTNLIATSMSLILLVSTLCFGCATIAPSSHIRDETEKFTIEERRARFQKLCVKNNDDDSVIIGGQIVSNKDLSKYYEQRGDLPSFRKAKWNKYLLTFGSALAAGALAANYNPSGTTSGGVGASVGGALILVALPVLWISAPSPREKHVRAHNDFLARELGTTSSECEGDSRGPQ